MNTLSSPARTGQSKATRLAMAAVFRKARKEIAAGREHHICIAIGVFSGSSEARACVQLIRGRLTGAVTLEGWLDQSAGVGPAAYKNYARARATRLAWLDSLIEEFSA